jgi:hypothetical protein
VMWSLYAIVDVIRSEIQSHCAVRCKASCVIAAAVSSAQAKATFARLRLANQS